MNPLASAEVDALTAIRVVSLIASLFLFGSVMVVSYRKRNGMWIDLFAVIILAIHYVIYTTFIVVFDVFDLNVPQSSIAIWTGALRIHSITTVTLYVLTFAHYGLRVGSGGKNGQ